VNRTQVDRAGGRVAAAIRPVRPADLAALGDFFAGLSVQTRQLRFFGPVTPGPALLRILSGATGNVTAVVAIRDGVIVGHAMAADRAEPQEPRSPQGLQEARGPQEVQGDRRTDIGVVVADAWQGRGLGAALMRALFAEAQARGVTSVTMDVLHGNRRVLAMITGHWPAARTEHSRECVTIGVELPPRQRRHVPPAAGSVSRGTGGAAREPARRGRGPGLAPAGRERPG
jgi:GNAT superfamily N-acetyltransferase